MVQSWPWGSQITDKNGPTWETTNSYKSAVGCQ